MKKTHLYNSIIGISWVALCLQILLACGSSVTKTDNKKDTVPDSPILSKPSSSYADTLIITGPSAIFYNPDSLQLEKIRAINTKIIYESLTHDCFYQMRNARMMLKKYWPQIQVIETFKARYLLFIKADKKQTGIDLDTKNDICGIFLFNGEKDPILTDMTNIDTELGFYFKK